jgi:Family of unknown function (DUF6174)
MKFATWSGAATLAVAASALVGCGSADSAHKDEADSNLALWLKKGPPSYVYLIETQCLCKNREPVRVVVEDDVVTSSLSTTSGDTVPEKTMTELLRAVARDAGEDNSEFEADYDPDLGYLKRLQVDRKASVADDEFATAVSCLGAGTSDDVCPPP